MRVLQHMRYHWLQALSALVCITFTGLVHAESPLYMLKHNWMQCANESDVIDLADTKTQLDLLREGWTKFISGRCTAPNLPMWRVSQLTEKRTPKGQLYYCFNRIELTQVGEPQNQIYEETTLEERECVPSFMLSTVDAELRARKGDYTVRVNDPGFTKAFCTEGGHVQLRKTENGLFRTVFDLPWKHPPYFVWDVPAGTDIHTAIREGCKGADVR